MKRTSARIILVGGMLLAMTSCSKKVADTVTKDTPSSTEAAALAKAKAEAAANAKFVAETIEKVSTTRTRLEQVSGHVSLDLSMNGQSTKVSGDLKMKRNNIIQLTLQALGLITVGRLELTPEYMLILDNMNKRFVKLPYAEVPFLRDNGIDFYSFQSIFWNEMFLPGSKDNKPEPNAFTHEVQGKSVVLKHQARNFQLLFQTDASSGRLQQSSVKGAQGQGMDCAYQGWGNVKNETFPNKYQLNLGLGSQKVVTKFDISKMKTDDSWKGTPTKVDSKKYQELTLKQITETLMNLTK